MYQQYCVYCILYLSKNITVFLCAHLVNNCVFEKVILLSWLLQPLSLSLLLFLSLAFHPS